LIGTAPASRRIAAHDRVAEPRSVCLSQVRDRASVAADFVS